jgi:PAS domain S-box-containing protein
MPLERHAPRCWRGWGLRRAGLLLALAAAGEAVIMWGLSQVDWPLAIEAAADVLLLSLWLVAWLPLLTRGERRRFKVLLDTVGAGVYGADKQGRLLFINATGLRLLGRPEDDRSLIGQPLSLLTGDAPASGVPSHLCRADGTRFEVEAWSRPLPGDDGGHLGQVTSFVDISERLRLSREREQHEKTLAAVMSAVQEAIVTVDASMAIVEFNPAAERLFGHPRADVLGRSVELLIPLGLRPAHQVQSRRWLDAAEPALRRSALSQVKRLSALRADGTEFPALIDLARVQGPDGLLVTAVVRDLSTELALARALATDQARSDFLSRVSHELRTPLNAVMGFAELMIDQARGRPDVLAHAHHVRAAGSHLLTLVDDLLNLSSLEDGQLRLETERLSLDEVAASAALIASHQAAQGQVVLQAALPAWGLWADRARTVQVLLQLLDLALQRSRPGSEVVMSAWREGHAELGVSVRDHGPNPSAADLAALFQPFGAVLPEGGSPRGSGLGLLLARSLCRAMNGRMDARAAPGGGLEVRLWLPAAAPVTGTDADPSRQQPAPAEPQPEAAAPADLDVLYAEDEPVNRLLMQAMLGRLPGIALRVASDGAEALEMVREARPDLLLTDMHLGDMTGLQLAARLGEAPETAGLRIAAVSADAMPESREAAEAAGFMDYLLKPIVREELEGLLERVRAQRG